MAAWKLGSIALLAVAASGVVALVMKVLLGRQFVGGNPAAAVAIPSSACRYWMGAALVVTAGFFPALGYTLLRHAYG